MSDLPFGFGPGSGDDDEGDEPAGGADAANPFAALFGGSSPADMGSAFARLGQLLSYEGGPVNWDLARDVARQTAAEGGDPTPSAADRRAVDEAVRLAEVWLDPVTALPAGGGTAQAWSRAEWVEQTLPAWKELIDPVAEKVVAATAGAVPAEMQAMAGPMLGMMRQLGGAMFGAQVGQGLGALATEVVGSTDVGLPIGPPGRAVLLPGGLERFGAGLGVPADEVRLYLALRECAHQRLFAHVPWLRARLFGAVEDYARGIVVDPTRLEEVMRSVDPSSPEAVQEALQSGMFEPEDTPAQKAALTRLETLLALVEGWVDAVVTDAAHALPSSAALRETVRRARATGGPAEQTFATLVGLELRPRRLREATDLWAELKATRGIDGRDAVWAHAELLPTADDLDDPAGFAARDELDLSGLEGLGDAEPEGGEAKPDGDEPPTE
ncbi:MAG: zinc-dependent metalloprotease [Actinomycetes bacterium]